MGDNYIINLENVSKEYGKGVTRVLALDDVSLKVARGESVAIEGPSGSGKSTLLQIIGALDAPTSGRVLVDGVNPFELSDGELSKFRNNKIGFVFQFFNLLPYYNAEENVALPLLLAGVSEKDARERAAAVLCEIGMGDRLTHRPNQLSGGQMQRVAIARALVTNPAVILADEPTGNLDRDNKTMIADLLSEVSSKGATLIVVTHDLALSKRFDRVIKIEDGRLLD